MMNRKMVDAVLSMGEYNRFSKGIYGWVGFKTKWLEYENIERPAGKTKWAFWLCPFGDYGFFNGDFDIIVPNGRFYGLCEIISVN